MTVPGRGIDAWNSCWRTSDRGPSGSGEPALRGTRGRDGYAREADPATVAAHRDSLLRLGLTPDDLAELDALKGHARMERLSELLDLRRTG